LKFELHLNVEQETTAIALLNQHCDLSINQLKNAINKGALWHTKTKKNTPIVTHNNIVEEAVKKSFNKYTKRLRRAKALLAIGDALHFYYDENILILQPEPAQLIADLHAYSIWYKPYGMLCQGSKWSDHYTINRWVETHIEPQRPAFIVHRLDRAASGLIIIAHSKKAAKAFSQLFEQHQLTKTYQIISHGDHRAHPQPEKITFPIDNKVANSSFYLLEYNNEYNLSLIKVNIGSGRKHQIRKHAAAINLPVVGDRLHGDKKQHYPDQLNLQLCAVSLAFTCPITKKKQIVELPQRLKLSLINTINLLNKGQHN
jgi:tRNA pseudouridine32 synthase/23S rRNA pseudouridine746 synthase